MSHSLASELVQIIDRAADQLRALPEAHADRAVDGQWSAKQILGHLIDSAANNHQRIVRAQFTNDLVFQGYAQEEWLRVQFYVDEPWSAMIDFWQLYNLHLAHVIAHIPAETLTQPRLPHSLDRIAWQIVPADQPATLEYLIRDYVGHLQDHLKQLFATDDTSQT
ncbi:MAG: DinB family protein [Anaerolineae bacterium]